MSRENVERLRAWLETWTLEDLARGESDPSFIDPSIGATRAWRMPGESG
jgi:hypothetical protein